MKRTLGHYLLLTLAIVFFIEEFFFLATALGHAGEHPMIARRFFILTIGVFLSAVIAFYGFARRIEFAGVAVAALVVIQPAVGAASNVFAALPVAHRAVAIGCAAAGLVLLAVVIVRNMLRA